MATIFAPASGAGRAAIAVLRLSGPGCRGILEAMAGGCPAPRMAALRGILAQDGEVLDRGLVVWFPAPASYTGEDCAEFHVHGGRAVVRAVSRALLDAGARPAEPGEFTRRAYLNGKFDLLEAEGVADLIAADTDGQRRQALHLLDGAQSARLLAWAGRLRRVLAWQEALIDFPDEDLPETVERELMAEVVGLTADLAEAAQAARQGQRVRDGVVVAVTGAPNTGKSSLVNRLARRDVAITSARPGTTRDALEVWIELAGLPVCLVDTAGLRETDDDVEAEGVRRARARAATADLVVEVCDAAAPRDGCDVDAPGDAARRLHPAVPILRVANKSDLAPGPSGWLAVSALTGEGVTTLEAAIQDHVVRLTGPHPALSHARHETALRDALECLERSRVSALPELRGEELRLAMRALGRITGSVGVEDLLDTVFSAFCIGK